MGRETELESLAKIVDTFKESGKTIISVTGIGGIG